MDVLEDALEAAREGFAVQSDAEMLQREVEHMRQVITEYVNEVESGEKFGALVGLVPGLGSDDGTYGSTR